MSFGRKLVWLKIMSAEKFVGRNFFQPKGQGMVTEIPEGGSNPPDPPQGQGTGDADYFLRGASP